MPENNQPIQDQGMVFDAAPVAAGAPTPAPQTTQTQLTQPQGQGQPQGQQAQGMTFDAQPRSAETDALESARTLGTGSAAAPQSSFLNNVKEGVIGSGLQTLSKGAGLVNKPLEYVSDKIGDLLGLPKLAGPSNAELITATSKDADRRTAAAELTGGGKVGVGLEGLAEFMVGEEIASGAIKVLSVGDRMLEVAKAAKLLEKNETLAKALENQYVLKTAAAAGKIARSSAVTAGVGAGQAALHGEDPTKAAKWGAVGGAAGGALGAFGSEVLAPRTSAAAEKAAQDAVWQDFESRLNSSNDVGFLASDAANWATGTQTSEARDFGQAAQEIKDHFTPVYDELREASGGVKNPQTGRYGDNGFDEAVNQIKNAKKVIYSPNPSSTEALTQAEKELAEGNTKLRTMFGDNPKYAEAQAGWRKASTLEELHGAIDKSFSAPSAIRENNLQQIRAGGEDTTHGGSLAPQVDPRKFVTQVNNAITKIGPNNLKSALGDEGYNNLLQVRQGLANALVDKDFGKSVDQLTKQYLAKHGASSVSKTLGGPALGYVAGNAAHLLGASNPITASIGLSAAAIHFLYTHPNIGAPILKAASKYVPPAAMQAARQAGATHLYSPTSGTVQPLPKDVYSNDPSFQMNSDPSSDSIWSAYPKNEDLADAVIRHEGKGKEPTNPGNLRFAGQAGATAGVNGFAKFQSQEAGRAALVNQLAKWRREQPDMTPEAWAARYAPDVSHGGDNPNGNEAAYVAALMRGRR